MSGNTKKMIAFNYFGGKFTYLDELYRYFPSDFDHLCELFAGSAVITLNYTDQKIIRTINDINSNVINFFQVLRDSPNQLIDVLKLTPYSEEEYFNCLEIEGNSIEKARRFYVRIRGSHYGDGECDKSAGWYFSRKEGVRSGGQGLSRWNKGIGRLYQVAEILNKVQVINRDYTKAIKMCDYERAFFYVDPPYPLSTRSSKKRYSYEMDDKDHVDLAEALNGLKGKAMISSYDNDMYDELFSSWTKVKLAPKKNNASSSIKQEVIWFNYPITQTAGAQMAMDFNSI